VTLHLVEEQEFYEIRNLQQRYQPAGALRPGEKGAISSFSLSLDHSMFLHHHINYGPLDLLSDIGGVTEILIFFFGFFMRPVSRQSFVLRAMKLLYSARTADTSLLEEIDGGQPNPLTGKPRKEVRFELSMDEDNEAQEREDRRTQELERRRPIVLSNKRKWTLFCRSLCCGGYQSSPKAPNRSS